MSRTTPCHVEGHGRKCKALQDCARSGKSFLAKFAARSSVGQNACLSRRRPRVRVPSLPPFSSWSMIASRRRRSWLRESRPLLKKNRRFKSGPDSGPTWAARIQRTEGLAPRVARSCSRSILGAYWNRTVTVGDILSAPESVPSSPRSAQDSSEKVEGLLLFQT
jgi:hypothetical protein